MLPVLPSIGLSASRAGGPAENASAIIRLRRLSEPASKAGADVSVPGRFYDRRSPVAECDFSTRTLPTHWDLRDRSQTQRHAV
jgi:hypothetical protein